MSHRVQNPFWSLAPWGLSIQVNTWFLLFPLKTTQMVGLRRTPLRSTRTMLFQVPDTERRVLCGILRKPGLPSTYQPNYYVSRRGWNFVTKPPSIHTAGCRGHWIPRDQPSLDPIQWFFVEPSLSLTLELYKKRPLRPKSPHPPVR